MRVGQLRHCRQAAALCSQRTPTSDQAFRRKDILAGLLSFVRNVAERLTRLSGPIYIPDELLCLCASSLIGGMKLTALNRLAVRGMVSKLLSFGKVLLIGRVQLREAHSELGWVAVGDSADPNRVTFDPRQ